MHVRMYEFLFLSRFAFNFGPCDAKWLFIAYWTECVRCRSHIRTHLTFTDNVWLRTQSAIDRFMPIYPLAISRSNERLFSTNKKLIIAVQLGCNRGTCL